MKNVLFTAGSLLLLLMILVGMIPDRQQSYTPVLMKRSDLENSVRFHPEGRTLTNPGKIYVKPPYLYINERYKGIHVINNADPRHPVREGFITAPGCIDLAVKDHILYLDNSVDLVAFDLGSKQVTQRLKDIFPQPSAPDNSIYYHPEEGMVIVEWKKNP
jgi:hypothetical protein